MKRLLFAILIIVTPFSAYYFYNKMQRAYVKVEVKPNIDKELREKATKSYLEKHIKEALNSDNIEDAKTYLSLAKYLKVDINSTLINKYNQANNPLNRHIREAKSFIRGFISGKSSNGYSLAGSVTSDFTFVGDIRDTYKEGKKYLNNQPYDKITLSLSVIGIALTATTIASMGANSPVKVGTSILKSANKSRYLTRGFKEMLNKNLAKSVDLKVLKEVNFHSLKSIEKSSKKFLKSVNLKPIKALTKDLIKLKKNTSSADAIYILKYINNQKELNRAIKLSQKYKKDTKGVLKVLGKGALRGSKFVLKKSAKYIYYLYSFVASIVTFIISLLCFGLCQKNYIK